MKAPAIAAFCTLLIASVASADDVQIVARGRVEAGAIVESRPGFDTQTDLHVDAIPEADLYWQTLLSQLSLAYTFTVAIHTAYASQTGHNLALLGSTQLSPRTTLSGGATASRTTLGNIFLTQPASGAANSLIPNSTRTSVVNLNVNQALNHDLSERVRLDQEATATAYKTLEPSPPLTSLFAAVGGGAERIWDNDGVGGGVLVGLSRTDATPPVIDRSFLLLSGGPRWRHDWSRSWSSLIQAGLSVAQSLSPKDSPYWAPTARAQIGYNSETSQATLVVGTGLNPNPLTGQVVQSHEATLHGVTPISIPAHLFIEGSVGYTHGRLIDRILLNDYDNLITDVGLVWEISGYVEVFTRYTLVAQQGASALGDVGFFRNSVLAGISIASRPLASRGATPGGGGAGEQRVPVANPMRVDRTDRQGAAQDRPPPSDAPTRQQEVDDR